MTVLLAIIGWLFLVVIGCWYTMFAAVVSMDGLGPYNIGGRINKWTDRVFVFGVIAFGLLLWWFVFYSAPFKISLTF
jgi:hypothetical protein